ncbi:hypothetical protein SELMODRAFT_411698 [Selaginella moellendorffii]|uniref:Uncharacterized protein n=1 Tax=Selaginella moellendorffii TaxID=88036 RepID=D8RIR5_SELML|nr:hypothetical protein SELMODRAFT_411698 [Selaginella moellendorffii]
MLSVALLMLLFLRVLSKAYWQRQLLAMGKDDHLWVIDIPGVGDKSVYLLMEQRKTRATTDVKCDGQRHGGCLSGDFRLATPSLVIRSWTGLTDEEGSRLWKACQYWTRIRAMVMMPNTTVAASHHFLLQLHLHKLVEASTGSSRRPTPDAQRDYYGGYFGVQRHGKTSTQELLLMDQAIYGSQNEGQTV